MALLTKVKSSCSVSSIYPVSTPEMAIVTVTVPPDATVAARETSRPSGVVVPVPVTVTLIGAGHGEINVARDVL